MDVGDDPQGDIVDGQLVVAGAQGTALLEPTHHPLDDVMARRKSFATLTTLQEASTRSVHDGRTGIFYV